MKIFMNLNLKNCKTWVFLVFIFSFRMAWGQDYFWVGGTGNWSDLAHWATTSGGNIFHSQLPGAGNDVYFDANSFISPSQVVTVDLAATANSMDWTGVSNTPDLKITNDITLSGSLTLNPGMTLSGIGTFRFNSAISGNTITSAGLSIRNLSFEGSGEWSLQDDLPATSSISFVEGTFNTNNHSVNASYFYAAPGNLTRQINLGSSTINCSIWDFTYNENLSLDAGTSWITVQTSLYGGSFTYYDVTIGGPFSFIGNSNTFQTLTFASGANVSLESGETQTTSDLLATGDCANLITIKAYDEGITAALLQSTGTINLEYVKLRDLVATGGAVFNATNSVDAGNNSGWNITSLANGTYYWVGNSGNWSDPSHWSLSSGGISSGCLPTPVDDVVFDANSFTSTGQTVTIDDIDANCKSMNWTEVSNSPTLAGFRDLNIYGSLILAPDMAVTYSNGVADAIYFRSPTTGNTIMTAGHSLNCRLRFKGSGEWTLLDNLELNSPKSLYLDQGSLITNSNDITVSSFYLTNDLNRSLTLGNSVINCTNQWNLFNETNLTIDAGNSTIVMGASGIFYGGNQVYYDVTLNTDQLINITGNNSYHQLTVTNSENITFDAGTTQTTEILSLPSGPDCIDYVELRSTVAGFPATLSMPVGSAFNGSYYVIRDLIATGGGTFNATNSVGIGNTSGWNISSAPAQNYYWIGGTGSWNEAENWSLTSGGSAGSCLPTVKDNVFFDENSFTADNQFVFMNGTAYCKSMDWTGANFNPELSGGGKLMINASLTLIEEMTLDYSGSLTFLAEANGNTILTGGQSLTSNISLEGPGEYTLQGDFETSGDINFLQGTFNTNGFDMSLADFESYYTITRSLNFYSSTISLRNWTISDATNLTFDAGTSEMIFLPGGSSFTGEDLQYYDVTALSQGAIFMTGSNTFNFLTLNPGTALQLEEFTTQEVSRLYALGTESFNIYLTTMSPGMMASISQSTPNFCGDYLNIQDISVSGIPFFAGTNSVDLGNNTGWSFTDCTKPVVDAGNDATICFGENVVLGGSPTASGATAPYTYLWTPGEGISDLSLANPESIPSDTIEYIVAVIDNLSAQNTDTIMIFVNPLPTATAGPDATICQGSQVQLGASGGVSYSWTPTTSLDNSSIANPVAGPSSTITYDVQVTDVNGCSNTASLTINVDTPSLADAGSDAAICQGESIILNGTGGTTYAWAPTTSLSDATIANPVATPSITTEYILIAANGVCTSNDTVTITVLDKPLISAGPNLETCVKDTISLGASLTVNSGLPPYTYSWSPASTLSENTVANPLAYPMATTDYIITVQDANGCFDSDTIRITVNPLPVADAGADITVCPMESVTIGGSPSASGGTLPYGYSWSPSTVVDNISESNPQAATVGTVDVILSLVDSKGCVSMDTIVLTVNDMETVGGFTYNDLGEGTIEFIDASVNAEYWSWNFGDGTTLTDQNPTHTFSSDGSFQVCLTVGNTCYQDTYCETITAMVTGLEVENHNPRIRIHPNPVDRELLFTIDFDKTRESKIFIYALNGQIMYHAKVIKPGNEYRIGTTNWPKGIYMIIFGNKKERITSRFVISR